MLHDLPMAGRAGDFVVQVETSPVRLSCFESVGRSSPSRLDKYGLSSPLWSDCVMARAKTSGSAGSISLTGFRRECGKRAYHLRLLPESPRALELRGKWGLDFMVSRRYMAYR